MSIFDQPVIRISYREGMGNIGEKAAIVTYSADGKMHSGKPKSIPVSQIPVLLFQLVERDYAIYQDAGFHSEFDIMIGFLLKPKSILAFSAEYRMSKETTKITLTK